MVLQEIVGSVFSCIFSFFTFDKCKNDDNDRSDTATSSFDSFRVVDASEVLAENSAYCRPTLAPSEEDFLILPRSTNVESSGMGYGTNSYRSVDETTCRSFVSSLWNSLSIMIAVIPLGIIIIIALYIDFNLTDLCFEQKRQNGSLPFTIQRWRLIGDAVQGVPIQLWFPFFLVVFFGWKEYKAKYIITLHIGFVFGCLVAGYKVLLFLFGVYETKEFYRYPGNVMFFIQLIYSSYFVAKNVVKIAQPCRISKLRMVVTISGQIVFAFVFLMLFRYAIINWFRNTNREIYRALYAMLVPVYFMLPDIVCKQLVTRCLSFGIADPGRHFILSYGLQNLASLLYRTMQADVKNISTFIGLSLVGGLMTVLKKATVRLRNWIWNRVLYFLNKSCSCCSRAKFEQFTSNESDDGKRLDADLEVQRMLCEYTVLILSQIDIAFYLILNFDVSPWPILQRALVRIAIGVGVDLFFNCISIVIQDHWFHIPVRHVWINYWKLHILCNVFSTAMTIWFLGGPILEFIAVRKINSFNITKCTRPFQQFV